MTHMLCCHVERPLNEKEFANTLVPLAPCLSLLDGVWWRDMRSLVVLALRMK